MSVRRYKVEELECCFQADMVESPTGEYVEYADYEKLKAENERLRQAGDALEQEVIGCYFEQDDPADSESLRAWRAAKEGKQP